MFDVRRSLGVKSVSVKVEKRVLERIGHVMRMGNERLTKAVVLGWYKSCLLYTSPSPRDKRQSRMPSSA